MARPPAAKEVQEFQFKLHCRLRVFPSELSFKYERPLKLLASSSKYGLTYVVCPTGVQCINVASILDLGEAQQKSRKHIADYPRRELALISTPTHIDISCDSELLAVTLSTQNCPMLQIYSVPSFGSKEIMKKHEILLSNTPGVHVLDIQWNPGVPNIIGAVLSDGSVIACEFKDNSFSINTLPAPTQATCLCWSPKGKQVVIGDAKGALTQYKPELKFVKSFPAPQLTNHPQSVVSIQWLSSYQFAAVYKDTVDTTQKPALVIVNAPKSGEVTHLNYECICYGSGINRPQHFFIHQQTWNMLIIGCGNSMELGVLKQLGEPPTWEQWYQGEATRAELPLTDDHQDVYTVGLSFDTSSQKKIPVGENRTIDPMPIVHMMSHEGVLCMFYSINLLPNATNLCSAPQSLPDQSGLSLFTAPQAPGAQVTTPVKTTPESQPSFITSTPATSAPATNLFSSAFAPSTPNTQVQGGFFSSSLMGQSNTTPIRPQTCWGSSMPLFKPSVATSPSTMSQPTVETTVQPLTSTMTSGYFTGQQGKPFSLLGQSPAITQQQGTVFWLPQSQQQTATTQQQATIAFQPNTTVKQPVQQPVPTSQPQQKQPESNILQQSLLQQKQATSCAQQLAKTSAPVATSQTQPVEGKLLQVGARQKQQSALLTTPSTEQPPQQQTVTQSPQLQVIAAASILQQPPQSVPQLLQQKIASPILHQQVVTHSPQQQVVAQSPQQQVVTQPPQKQPSAGVLQQTTVPQPIQGLFSLSSSQAKGGLMAGSNFTPTLHRKQDHIKAVTVVPLSGSNKGVGISPSQNKSKGFTVNNMLGGGESETNISTEALKEKYNAAIQSEVKKFGAELNALKGIISNIIVNIGDEEEKKMLKVQTENLEAFGADLRETTTIQESEVSMLQSNLMEAFTWFENIYRKHSRLNDSKYSPLNDFEELDPISRKHIKSIEKNLLYLESHVKSINSDLETQWIQTKIDLSKKSSFEVPALETIFQSIMTIYKLITQQKTVLADLENRVPVKAKKLNFQQLKMVREKKHIPGDTELSKLAEKLLSAKLCEREELNGSYSEGASKYKSLLTSQHCLNSKQETALRQWHKHFKVIGTRIIKKRMVTDEMINLTVNDPEESVKSFEISTPPAVFTFSNNVIGATSIQSNEQVNPLPNPSVLPTNNIATSTSQSPNSIFPVVPSYIAAPGKPEGAATTIAPTEGIAGSLFGITKQNSGEKIGLQNGFLQSVDNPAQNHAFSSFGQNNFNHKPTPNVQDCTPKFDSSSSAPAAQSPKSDAIPKQTLQNFQSPGCEMNKVSTKKEEGQTLDGGSLASGKSLGAGDGDITAATTKTSIFGGQTTITPGTFLKPSTVNCTGFGFMTSMQASSFAIPDRSFAMGEISGKLTAPAESAPGLEAATPGKDASEKGNSAFSSGSLSSAAPQPPPAPAPTPLTSALLKTPQPTPSCLTQGQTDNAPSTNPAVETPKSEANLLLSFGELSTSTEPKPSGNSILGGSTSSLFSAVPPTAADKPFSFTNKAGLFGSGQSSLFGIAVASKSPAETSDPNASSRSEPPKPTAVSDSPAKPAVAPAEETAPHSSAQTAADRKTPEPETSVDETENVSACTSASEANARVPAVESTAAEKSAPPQLSFGSMSISSSGGTGGQTSSMPFFGGQSSFTSSTPGSGLPPTSSVFAAAAPAHKLFGNGAPTTAATATTTAPILEPAPTLTPAPVATTSSTSIFGSVTTGSVLTAQTPSSTPSFFGPTTSSTSLFGGVAPATTASTSVFDAPKTSAAPQPTVFGGEPAPTGAAAPATTAASSQSIFGPPTCSAAGFGAATSAPSFSPAATTASTLFGAAGTLSFATPTTSSAFGATPTNTTTTTTTTPSFFGTPGASGFVAPTTTVSVFGTPTTSTFGVQSPSVFGATTSAAFGTPSTSGSSFSGQASAATPATTSSGVFGSSVFGQPATTNSFMFGSCFGQKPIFGQSGTSVFGQSSNAGNFGSSGGSLFGSSGFGAQNQQQSSSNLFQSPGGSNIFGGAANAASGSFSGGNQSVGQTGFGSPPSFQNKPPAFVPTGSTVFGSQPAFGASPTFGGAATFGSPNKVFGSPPQTAFSNIPPPQQTSQTSTFETLATQNTMTFGNLAQNQPTTGFGSFSPPQQTTTQPTFGGSSFSTWR